MVKSKLSCGVRDICSNSLAFAAVKGDGSVATWGDRRFGGDCSAVQEQLAGGVRRIHSTSFVFAALMKNGSVVTWGDCGYGGHISGLIQVIDDRHVMDESEDAIGEIAAPPARNSSSVCCAM
eukprot:gnl/TRDRNA2_/TRDRNA2_154757_c1_seq2.p1 gnl/TRDRNA2_/TRDRNA2_154757_c1~~gnl/TRDRNA2_/TRDRNA2_154757_c1_seq2.p1  ORF type:complete len:122 (-),score=15.06 gnl/TRDRNA2_/TRDRNA2_154757_c1_seq2:285-650(-)